MRTLLLIALMAAGLGPTATLAEPHLPDAPTVKLPDSKTTDKMPGAGLGEGNTLNVRTTVDQSTLPWSAVGRLRAGTASCTASLIGPALLLTAAHCVFDPRTQRPFPPQALHFMLGYAQGRYVAEAWGVHVTFPDTYDATRGAAAAGDDWAVVELGQPIGTPDRVLALSTHPPAAGDVVTLGGYAAERIEQLIVDTDCRVTGALRDRNGVVLIHHNCTANHGVSGAPLLIQDGAAWTILGVEDIGSSPNDGGAATIAGVRAALAKRGEGASQRTRD